jgi:hypothetical protein
MFLGRPTEIRFSLNMLGTPDTRPTYDALYSEF